MAGEAGAAAIQILIQNLVNISKDEISLIKGLHRNAHKLRVTFSVILGFLDDAHKKLIAEKAVKAWLKELEDVAFHADNVLDELNYHLLSNRITNTTDIASCFPSFNHYLRRRRMALRIKEINTNFESLRKTAMDLGLQKIIAEAPVENPSETDSVALDPIFIGRDDDVSRIVQMLTAPTEQPVSVVPIVGMGGLGKTTLARKVFNHEKTRAHFEHHIWVHVSQHFDAVFLFKKVLTNLKVEIVEHESRESLLEKIEEALGAETYLLVLDDVWNQDPHKWDDFINSWSGINTCKKGNGVVVTTRSAEVGSIVKTHGVHNLNGLTMEECWSIIKGRAFRGGDIPPGFEDIGRSIAGRCGGLPLAAAVVGGMLRDKSRDVWISIKDKWLSDVVTPDENNISKILKLSFDHLSSSSLKKCFAYCSVFPKGTRIKGEELIELWMAEGFLQPSQTSDMESDGSRNFNLLLHSSLLQVFDKDEYDNVLYCGMHDLVHDLASSVLGTNDARYVYWDCESSQEKYLVRTLFYRGNVSDIMLSDFRSLHALTLVGLHFKELPDSIRELIHLRYLNISKTSIRYLPDSIGELYHLQTIRSSPLYRTKLPSKIKYLLNLRHLYLDRNTELPPQMGVLTSLRTLLYFKVRDEEGHRIAELGSLKNLKGKLEICNLERVQGEEESKKACLFQKSGIVKLALVWCESREGGERNDENVLKGLQPHSNLKVLEIISYEGARLPPWSLKMAGYDNLTEMRLESCEECEEIPRLGHLPCLKYLYLIGLRRVKSIGYSFYGIDDGVCGDVFPSLERLEVGELWGLWEWVGVEITVKVFPCLKYLRIFSCGQLREVDNICSVKIKTLWELEIRDMEGLTCLPNWLFQNNHLWKLRIEECPNLRELPDGLHSLNSLEELRLKDCNTLKSINGALSFASLRRLDVGGCQAAITLSNKLVESSAPLLEKLYIDVKEWESGGFDIASGVDGILRLGAPSFADLRLKDMDYFPSQLQLLTSLSELWLHDFGVEELPDWFGDLSSLRGLHLGGAKKLRRLASLEAMRRLTKLTWLDIFDCPLLQVRCIDDDFSEWPKICHIPTIMLDYNYIQRDGRQIKD